MTPVRPSQFFALLPLPSDSVGRFLVKAFRFFVLWLRYSQWERTSGGWLSDEAAAEECAARRQCSGIEPPTPTCIDPQLTASASAGDTTLVLTCSGGALPSGWAYKLVRQAADLTWPTGTALTSGTTSGNQIAFTDTGLTNGTTYRYRFYVKQPNCAERFVECEGVPTATATTLHAVLGWRDFVPNCVGGSGTLRVVGNLTAANTVDVYWKGKNLETGEQHDWIEVTTGVTGASTVDVPVVLRAEVLGDVQLKAVVHVGGTTKDFTLAVVVYNTIGFVCGYGGGQVGATIVCGKASSVYAVAVCALGAGAKGVGLQPVQGNANEWRGLLAGPMKCGAGYGPQQVDVTVRAVSLNGYSATQQFTTWI